jgi:hypothetical protein
MRLFLQPCQPSLNFECDLCGTDLPLRWGESSELVSWSGCAEIHITRCSAMVNLRAGWTGSQHNTPLLL